MKISSAVIDNLSLHFLRRKGNTSVAGTIKPSADNTYNLGSDQKRFGYVYTRNLVADNITGNVTGNADMVDNFHAAGTPQADTLLALDGNAVFPVSVYPGALLTDGSRQLTGDLSVADGVTIDGYDLSDEFQTAHAHYADSGNPHGVTLEQARQVDNQILGQIDIAPSTSMAPFILGANAQGQLVTGLNADLLDGKHAADFAPAGVNLIAGAGLTGGGAIDDGNDITFNVGAGDGINVLADSVGVDGSVARDTWAINAGDGLSGGGNLSASGISLAVDGTVVRTSRQVIAGYGLTGGGTLDADVTLDLSTSISPTWTAVHTFQAGLKVGGVLLTELPAGYLRVNGNLAVTDGILNLGKVTIYQDASDNLYFGGNAVIIESGNLQAEDWVSGSVSWGISDDGSADFRDLYADNLHVSTFISDMKRVEDGTVIIGQSLGTVAVDFVTPANGFMVNATFYDNPQAPDTQLFAVDDVLVFRWFNNNSGVVTAGYVYFRVESFVSDNSDGTQTWELEMLSDGDAIGKTIYEGSIAVDIGAENDGSYIKLTAVESGSPFIDFAYNTDSTITSSPIMRLGNLEGLIAGGGVGMYASGGSDGRIIMSDTMAELRNIVFRSYLNNVEQIRIQPDEDYPYIAIGSPAPSAYYQTGGIYIGYNAHVPKISITDETGNAYVTLTDAEVSAEGQTGSSYARLTFDGTITSHNDNGDTSISGGILNVNDWFKVREYGYNKLAVEIGGKDRFAFYGEARDGFEAYDFVVGSDLTDQNNRLFYDASASRLYTKYLSVLSSATIGGNVTVSGDLTVNDTIINTTIGSNPAGYIGGILLNVVSSNGGQNYRALRIADPSGDDMFGLNYFGSTDDTIEQVSMGVPDGVSLILGSGDLWGAYAESYIKLNTTRIELSGGVWAKTGGIYAGSSVVDVSSGVIGAADYIYALGGLHVGGSSDPGTGRMIVDGGVRIGSGTAPSSGLLVSNVVGVGDYLYAYGGIHVGGNSDPGTDTLLVDGLSKLYGGATIANGHVWLVQDGSNWFVAARNDDSRLYMGASTLDGHIYHRDVNSYSRLYLNWYGGTSSNYKDLAVGNGNQTWGRVLASQFVTQSTRESKRDIKDLDAHFDSPALDKVKKLRPVAYRKKDNPEDKHQYLSLIAEELDEVLPEAVYHHPETGKAEMIDMMAVVPVLIKSIQELSEQVETLERQLKKVGQPIPRKRK